jgi:hypothetical protein
VNKGVKSGGLHYRFIIRKEVSDDQEFTGMGLQGVTENLTLWGMDEISQMDR